MLFRSGNPSPERPPLRPNLGLIDKLGTLAEHLEKPVDSVYIARIPKTWPQAEAGKIQPLALMISAPPSISRAFHQDPEKHSQQGKIPLFSGTEYFLKFGSKTSWRLGISLFAFGSKNLSDDLGGLM